MTNFLLNDANFWFSVALAAVIVLAIIECVGLFFRVSLLGLFDQSIAINSEFEAPEPNPDIYTRLVQLLSLDRLPIMIWLAIFLLCFGLTGFTTNWALSYFPGKSVRDWINVPASIITALFATRYLARLVATWLPNRNWSPARPDNFKGRTGEITMGTARYGCVAEAKVLNQFEQPRYVLVEAAKPEEHFKTGDKVVFIKQTEKSWLIGRP
ncbi:DUF1449 family protein [Alteromonas aestuariivivens]|uniref:DUF1449 family protein n=1 Tax=Alteromonas aestuariivivens TaxID=1938339 RepID=A0A3D8M3Y9_9ALTE|nr:OB-fold-containig protein [Alteromonas aestuariivivens]RDV24300.1 DUF1449 family protein [Alteromonas aestuariivivens]